MRGDMRVLVRSESGKRQIAALEEGRLMEYVEEEESGGSMVGAIVLGMVERVLPSLSAAFVKTGQPLNGFLPLKEMESIRESGNLKPLSTGQEVLVQVKKDAKDGKGAFLSRDIALPGLYCIWMPLNRHTGVSGRVNAETDRERLLTMGRALVKDHSGIIMRHAALSATQDEVREELEELKARWMEILAKAQHQKPPVILHRESSALTSLLRDHAGRYDISVVAATQECALELPSRDIALILQNEVEMEALWQGAGISRQLKEALSRQVNLTNGGTLVIDEREALTTIDVNSGKFVEGAEDIALAQNLAACGEIARQIRLRNLGGIVLIDFIDMEKSEEQSSVIAALEACLARDRTKTVVHGFTRLGLLEMTRKRSRESLSRILTEPCTACHESGRRPMKEKATGERNQ